MVNDKISVVISICRIYTLIKERLKNVLVIEIKISAYYTMRSILEMIDRQEPVAVLGFDNIIYGVEILEGLKGLNIQKVKLDKIIPLNEKIEKRAQEGIKVFIGDTFVEKICSELDYECYLIKNGIHSLIGTVERAQEIVGALKKDIERKKRFAVLRYYVMVN